MNKSKQKKTLMEIAGAISDGSAVNWTDQNNEAITPQLENLKAIEKLARACEQDIARNSEAEARPGSGAKTRSTSDLQRTNPATCLFVWGHLLVIEMIAQGNFGEVYEAYDPQLQLRVALKLLKADLGEDSRTVDCFLKEARNLARVRHPNIVRVYGADIHSGRAGLWTEFVKGKTLSERSVHDGLSSAEEAAATGIILCGALAALHSAGLVHRDVKPANVMREEGGRVVLMDFGCAGEGWNGSDALHREDFFGTPLATAPEVLLNGEAARPGTDNYALGVLLYWMASGRYPVEANSLSELCAKHRRKESLPLLDARSDLPLAFVRVVERALSYDSGERYGSAGEMQQALIAFAFGETQESERIGEGAEKKRIAKWLTVAALVLAATLLAWRVLFPPSGSLGVDASLYRVGRAGGVEERLMPGASIATGDKLFLEIQGTRAMHVYVLSQDDSGVATVLFPIDSDLKNPLSREVRHRLPGKLGGKEYDWQVTTQGARETMLVIASIDPLDAIEKILPKLQHAEPGRFVEYEQISPTRVKEIAHELRRSIQGMVENVGPDPDSTSSELSKLGQSLTVLAAKSSGIWKWEIQLAYQH